MNEPPAVPVARRVPAWAWDLVTGVVVVAAALLPSTGHNGDHRPYVVALTLWTIAIAIAAALVVPLRRRWPISVLLTTIALFSVGTLVVGSSLPFVPPMAIATFGVTARLERQRSIPVVAVTVALLVVVELLVGPAQGFDPRLIPVPALVAFAGAVGDATRSHRAYIDAITERAERAERTKESEAHRRVAEERLRIARDLHDAAAHRIAVISLHSGVASRAISSDREVDLPAARASLATIGDASRTVLAEIRDLLAILRSDAGTSAPTAPPPGLGELDDLLAGFVMAGLETTVRVEGTPRRLPSAVDRVAHQVIREGLTNAHKHGTSGRAHVLLEYRPEGLGITITNPVDATREQPATGPSTGLGLIGLRERVAAVRGTANAGTTGSVHRLVADLPTDRGDDA